MSERRPPIHWWVWLTAGIVLAALVAPLLIWWQPIYEFVAEEEKVRAWVEGFGGWGPVAIIVLAIVQALLAPIPGQAIQAVSGYLYGPWLGTLYSMIGLVSGSLITFSLARRFGRPLASRLIGERSMGDLDDLVRRGGAPFFFLIWLVPFAPDDLACVAAGFTPMPSRQFLLLMIPGRLPGVIVSVVVGASLFRVNPIWWIVLFVAVAVGAFLLWRWGGRIQESVLALVERASKRWHI